MPKNLFIFCRYHAIIFPMRKIKYISVEQASQNWQIRNAVYEIIVLRGELRVLFQKGKPGRFHQPQKSQIVNLVILLQKKHFLHFSNAKRMPVLKAEFIIKFRLTLLIIQIILKAQSLPMTRPVISLKQKLLELQIRL